MSIKNKGQFGKGNVAAKGKSKSTKKRSTFIISNSSHSIDVPIEIKPTRTNTRDYIPFGDNNLFPQKIYKTYRKSGVNRSVITSKRNYVIGEGFTSENDSFNNWTPNPNETLRDLSNKAVLDKIVTGNGWIEIVLINGEMNWFHKDTTTVRIHKGGEHAILHPDWSNFEGFKKFAKVIPLYPKFEMVDGFKRSMLQIKDYEANFVWYGIPSNIGALDSAKINEKTNSWNLSRLENSFKISGILNIVANFSDEDAKAFEEKIKNKFTGEDNQAKLLTIIQEIGGEANPSTFVPIETNEEGNWINLHTQATNEIIISNQWFASLAGVNINTGFDTNRIRNDYQIAISTIIPYEQKFFIEAYQRVLNDQLNFGLDDLAFVNKSPLNNIDLIDFTDTVGKNERRAFMGLEPVEEEDVKKSLNGAQITSMVGVITAFKEGTISEIAGIQILMTGFGLTEEAAKLFFK